MCSHTHKHFSFYSIVSLTGAESNSAMSCLQYYRVKLRIVLHSVLQSLTLRCPAIQYYRVLRVGLHDVLAVVIQSLTPRCPAYRSTESNSTMSCLQYCRVLHCDVWPADLQSLTPRCPAYSTAESYTAMSGLQIYRV